MVEIKLVVLWLAQSGWCDHYFSVNCDNPSVIGSFWKGNSRNPACNSSLGRSSFLAACNLSIFPIYVPSVQNRADAFSSGLTGAKDSHVVPNVILPKELCPFLEHI